jgi:MFS transporter, DHA2 family, multidrug resistance protein
MPASDSPLNRTMVVIAVMSATLMQMLDTTIVNVALPQMQGQLGTTASEISWVLTSYIVAATACTPLTGYFTDRLGQRKYLLLATGGFVIASVLCGLSYNLTQIVVFRIAQGVAGAALAPLSQAIMTGLYPPEERGKAMAMWGMGVTLGPVLGPTLGGWLTEALSWRWTFFINLPVGIGSILLALRYLPDSPKRERSMDWTGFTLLALTVGALQFVLDRGNRDDWFAADEIVMASMLCAFSFALFLRHALRGSRHPIFDPRLFLNGNFATATFISMALSLGIFGSMILQPILMESLLEYPVSVTGLLMAPRGLAVGFGMILVGRFADRIDLRILVLAGMACSFLGSYAMTRYTLDVDSWALVWPGLLQGLGIALIMVPLSVHAFTTLAREKIAEAAGMNSLLRNLGSAIGISIAATMLTRYTQQGWQQLGGYLNPYNPAVNDYLRNLHVAPNGATWNGATGTVNDTSVQVLAHEVARQSAIAGMSNVYWLIAVTGLAMVPLIMLLRPAKRSQTATPAIVMAE